MQLMPYNGANASAQAKTPLTSDELNKLYNMGPYTNPAMLSQTAIGFPNVPSVSGAVLANPPNLAASSYATVPPYLPQSQTMLYQFPYHQTIERPLATNLSFIPQPQQPLPTMINTMQQPQQATMLYSTKQQNPFPTNLSTNTELVQVSFVILLFSN